jgi:hypothetical protein
LPAGDAVEEERDQNPRRGLWHRRESQPVRTALWALFKQQQEGKQSAGHGKADPDDHAQAVGPVR